MKINTILFLLFTTVISMKITNETTLGSIGNEEDNYINITETTEENKVKDLFIQNWFINKCIKFIEFNLLMMKVYIGYQNNNITKQRIARMYKYNLIDYFIKHI